MNSDTETVEQKPEHVLYGKVIGVVKGQSQFDALVESLKKLGVDGVESYFGASGNEQMEVWKEAVSHYFFGDMEAKMVQRYLDAVADDLIVFAVVAESSVADKVGEVAKSQGAFDIAHFGNSAVTNY